MVEVRCYCDKCNMEFKSEYNRAFKVSNSFSLANPGKLIKGDSIFEAILCPECEKELLVWIGKEDCLDRIDEKKSRSIRI